MVPQQVKFQKIKKEITERKNKLSTVDWNAELAACNANDAFNMFHNKHVQNIWIAFLVATLTYF